MSIRELLSGIKPRTKIVTLTDDKKVTLHELSTSARMRIEKERYELSEKEEATTKDYNDSAARVVVMSLTGSEETPKQSDVDAVLDMLGLDQLDGLYIAAMKFSGLDGEADSEAKKN